MTLRTIRRGLAGLLPALIFASADARADAAGVPGTVEEARSILLNRLSAQQRSIVQIKLADLSANRKGSPKAPVVMLEFSDFECSRCRAFYMTTFPRIDTDLIETGKVLYIGLNYYLATANHAKAALAAGKLGKYWEMKDRLMTTDQALDERAYAAFARDLGLDSHAFHAAYESDDVAKEAGSERAQGRAAGVSITPTFLVGWALPDGTFVGARISGPKPWTFFRDLVDEMIHG